MLSMFPALFDYSTIAVFALRGTVGVFFFLFGVRLLHVAATLPERKTLVRTVGILYGGLKLGVGTLLLLGLYVQIAAALGALLSLLTYLQDKPTQFARSDKQVQILLFVISLSLLFLGPGQFAIDLPL